MILPLGGGLKGVHPIVRSVPVARAREETSPANADLVQVQSEVTTIGYRIDVWIPAECIAGFDPVTHPRIGFHYAIFDSELGVQTLAVGREFPFESDPSLWQTVELVS